LNSRKSAAPIPRQAPDAPAERTLRLLRLVDLQLDQLETRMTSGEPGTAQDQERHARAFSTLLGHVETLTEAIAQHDQAPGGERAQSADERGEAERLRREIAERLERLNAQWMARSKPE
jgi:hypothetical protein